MHAHRTRGITEAVCLYGILAAVLLSIGVWLQPTIGIYVTITAFVIAGLAQTAWLRFRAAQLR